jgi:hypothetical protein
MRFAAPLTPPLQKYLVRLACDRSLSIAEINRSVGERAEAIGGRRPSYAAVRLLVGDVRMRPDEPSWLDIYVDVAYHVRPMSAFEEKATGGLNKHLPEDYGIRHERR